MNIFLEQLNLDLSCYMKTSLGNKLGCLVKSAPCIDYPSWLYSGTKHRVHINIGR